MVTKNGDEERQNDVGEEGEIWGSKDPEWVGSDYWVSIGSGRVGK